MFGNQKNWEYEKFRNLKKFRILSSESLSRKLNFLPDPEFDDLSPFLVFTNNCLFFE